VTARGAGVTAGRRAEALAPARRVVKTNRGVLIFLFLGVYPWVLILTWGIAMYLTVVETRQRKMDLLHTLWWLQLVFLTHFIGYLALRGWVFFRRYLTA
jgi:hypothetical protein